MGNQFLILISSSDIIMNYAYCNPTQNRLHVTCMLHEIIIDLHYYYCTCVFHVTCMDLERFSCMLHEHDMNINMIVTCMSKMHHYIHATCIL